MLIAQQPEALSPKTGMNPQPNSPAGLPSAALPAAKPTTFDNFPDMYYKGLYAVAPASADSKAGSKQEDLTIDQLLDAVEKIEQQKAELEKKQRDLIKVLHLKVQLQKSRIDSLPGAKPIPSDVPYIPTPSVIPGSSISPSGVPAYPPAPAP